MSTPREERLPPASVPSAWLGVAVIGGLTAVVTGGLTWTAVSNRAAPDALKMVAMVNALCWGLPVLTCGWAWQRNIMAGRPGGRDLLQRFWQAQVLGLSLIPWMCGTFHVWGLWQ